VYKKVIVARIIFMEKLIDIYIDFLISSFGKIEMTKLSELLDGIYSHDVFTKMLLNYDKAIDIDKELWHRAKGLLRTYEDEAQGCILIDDTVLHKPYTKENDIVCWHYDHSAGKCVKGICMLNFHYTNADGISIPLDYEVISKTEKYFDKKSCKIKRRSKFTKNEILREKLLLLQFTNSVKYRYVLMDSWFISTENMNFIDKILDKKFISPLKSNREIALSFEDKIEGRYVNISSIDMESCSSRLVYVRGYNKPLKLTKQVSKDGNDGESTYLYLITNDIDLTPEKILEIYQRRWKVEEYHKSLKQNLKIEHSPTKVESSQRIHIFLSVCGFIELEKLRLNYKMNQFAIKQKIYIEALKATFNKVRDLKAKMAA